MPNGYETEKIKLNEEENTFKITVTSQDGTNTSVYTLIVNKGNVKYKVSLVPGEGKGENIVKDFAKGSTYTLPGCDFTAPDGKEFAGWKIGEEIKDPGQEITVNGETLITATWKDITFKVSLVPGEGTGEAIEKEYTKGSKYTLPECNFTAPDGQIFTAWQIGDKEYKPQDKITIDKETLITAIWQVKPIETVTVTLVANNGTNETIAKEVEKGKYYTLPGCDFTAPDGKEFAGWQIGEEIKKPSEKIAIDGETIITATWQVKSNETDPNESNPGEENPDKPNPDDTNPDKPNPGEEPNPDKPNPDKPNPDKPSQKHAINITPSPYGRVIIDPIEAKAGDKVTVRAIAKYGYELVGLSLRDASGKLLPIINGEFIMPDCEVDIYPIFREIAPYINHKIYDKAEREEQKRRARRNYYYEEENNEDEVKTIDKVQEEKQKESKVLITIGSEILDKVDNGVRTLKAMDTKPYIKGGRTMLPLRYVAEALGYKVAWLSESRTAVIMDLGLRVEIPVDSNFIIVNGVKYTSDVKPDMRNNRIMLPIANIARALGLKDGKDILWDEANRQVTLIRNFNTK